MICNLCLFRSTPDLAILFESIQRDSGDSQGAMELSWGGGRRDAGNHPVYSRLHPVYNWFGPVYRRFDSVYIRLYFTCFIPGTAMELSWGGGRRDAGKHPVYSRFLLVYIRLYFACFIPGTAREPWSSTEGAAAVRQVNIRFLPVYIRLYFICFILVTARELSWKDCRRDVGIHPVWPR